MDFYQYRWSKWFVLGLLSAIWGSSYILMKKGLVVFAPAEVAMLRIFIGGVFLLPFSLPNLRKLTIQQYKFISLYGAIGSLIPGFLVAKAQIHIPSSVNGVLNSLTPVFVLLVGKLFFRKKFSRNELIGAMLGVIGSMLLIFSESVNQTGKLSIYAMLPVLVCFLYGISINFTKSRLQNIPAQTIASVSLLLVGSIAGFILFTQTEFITKLRTVPAAYQAVGYIAILGTLGLGFSHILFASLIQHASPVFASTTSFLVPMIALAWGLLDGEKLIWQHYIGMMVILLGVYFINQYSASKKPST